MRSTRPCAEGAAQTLGGHSKPHTCGHLKTAQGSVGTSKPRTWRSAEGIGASGLISGSLWVAVRKRRHERVERIRTGIDPWPAAFALEHPARCPRNGHRHETIRRLGHEAGLLVPRSLPKPHTPPMKCPPTARARRTRRQARQRRDRRRRAAAAFASMPTSSQANWTKAATRSQSIKTLSSTARTRARMTR